MNTIKFLTVLALFIGFTSCDKDDDPKPLLEVKSESVTNLHAPQLGGRGEPVSGAFIKFDFASGTTTTNETEWDIAFRGTSIIVNGGESMGTEDEPERTKDVAAYIASGTMASIAEVNTASLQQDSENAYVLDDWYTYAGEPTHLINPTPGKILVIKTRTGKYAKLEILSYYKDAPAEPNAFTDETPYYTFNYVYQPNDGVTTF
ncbi:HmuY family protein [Aureibaculum sp. 2210JD6-5]|uniref:HmuY family protein n=1 Tax=Aureibaculum sp. 2210JD6-5 TaxID=3103957 RepID=UPI002AAEF2AE|nr:HmuY family protein [Aureibaculum sp. 2210JD6-5]MDY7395918.1 HmuY family protein [Aureibaculum sp. 2210JD6-5]